MDRYLYHNIHRVTGKLGEGLRVDMYCTPVPVSVSFSPVSLRLLLWGCVCSSSLPPSVCCPVIGVSSVSGMPVLVAVCGVCGVGSAVGRLKHIWSVPCQALPLWTDGQLVSCCLCEVVVPRLQDQPSRKNGGS